MNDLPKVRLVKESERSIYRNDNVDQPLSNYIVQCDQQVIAFTYTAYTINDKTIYLGQYDMSPSGLTDLVGAKLHSVDIVPVLSDIAIQNQYFQACITGGVERIGNKNFDLKGAILMPANPAIQVLVYCSAWPAVVPVAGVTQINTVLSTLVNIKYSL